MKTALRINLTEMRRGVGQSLREYAEVTGISAATLCRLERGLKPSQKTAIRLAKFLGVPVEKIWSVKDAA